MIQAHFFGRQYQFSGMKIRLGTAWTYQTVRL